MLKTLAVLFLFQILGDSLQRYTALPIPGPVLGMLLLFITLCIVRHPGEQLPKASYQILSHLQLLFIPASAGLIVYLNLLQEQFLALFGVVVVSTLLTLVLTIKWMTWLKRS